MASATEYTICIWDIQNNNATLIHTIDAHGDRIKSMILMKDGLTLASASEDRSVNLWDISTGELVKSLKEK